MLKVILDTNVFISGLTRSPSCRKIIKAFNEEKFLPVVSPETLDELIGVMARPKFHHIIVRENAEKLIETIKAQAILVKPSRPVDIIKNDPDDNRFLEAALEAKADFIVSGDHHLLELESYAGIPIVSAAKFLDELKK